jgi:hypothetical protein
MGLEETLIIPADDDEEGYLRWAKVALEDEGIEAALAILLAYLALNPDREDELAKEWDSRESAHNGEPRLA